MKNSKEKDSDKGQKTWVLMIVVIAFFLSVVMSILSDQLMKKTNIVVAFIILVAIILFGVCFDIIGVAVTVADEKPFNAMASHKIKGAKSSLRLIKNASRVSNVLNDVVGDTCGIISGCSAAYIVSQAAAMGLANIVVFSTVLSGFVASATIGGKAIGKEFAMNNSNWIVQKLGRVASIFIERR